MIFEGDGLTTADDENSFLQKSPHGAFASQLSFNSSDPYRDTTDAFRGVPMSQFGGWSGALYNTNNDPYADDDDVVRGCTMAQPPGPDFSFSKSAEDGFAGGVPSLGMPPALGMSSKDVFGYSMPPALGMPLKDGPYSSMPCPSMALEASASPLRFQQGIDPPVPPASQHFHFETTTLHITTNDASKFGNCILDFFDSQIVASVLKVRQEKYSIKVDFFLDHIMCTTKIRVWKVESKDNQYAIEYQRRGGDPFAFAEGVRQCIDFLALQFPENAQELKMHNGEERKRSMPQPPPPPSPTENPKSGEEDLDAELFTLLDLAGMHQFPNLQAEAASGLAKLACEDICIAKYLSKVRVLDKLLPLLACDSVDVIYPTARMLSALATTSTNSIAEHSITKVAIRKIGGSCSNQLVRLELAKFVSNAVLSCTHIISAAQAQELHHLLECIIQDLNDVPATEVIRNTLHDALFQLKPYQSHPEFQAQNLQER